MSLCNLGQASQHCSLVHHSTHTINDIFSDVIPSSLSKNAVYRYMGLIPYRLLFLLISISIHNLHSSFSFCSKTETFWHQCLCVEYLIHTGISTYSLYHTSVSSFSMPWAQRWRLGDDIYHNPHLNHLSHRYIHIGTPELQNSQINSHKHM